MRTGNRHSGCGEDIERGQRHVVIRSQYRGGRCRTEHRRDCRAPSHDSAPHGVWNVARASTKYAPATRSNVTVARHAPFGSQFVSVTGVTVGPPPTRGFTVTLTVVPVGTPDVDKPTAV